MADETTVDTQNTPDESAAEAAPAKKTTARKTAAKKTTAKKAAAKKTTTKKAAAKKAAAEPQAEAPLDAPAQEPAQEPAREPVEAAADVPAAADTAADTAAEAPADTAAPAKKTAKKAAAKKTTAKKATAKKTTAKKATSKKASAAPDAAEPTAEPTVEPVAEPAVGESDTAAPAEETSGAPAAPGVLFQAPEKTPEKTPEKPARKRAARKKAAPAPEPEPTPKFTAESTPEPTAAEEETDAESIEGTAASSTEAAETAAEAPDEAEEAEASGEGEGDESGAPSRRRRRRGGRRRRKSADAEADNDEGAEAEDQLEEQGEAEETDDQGESGSSRRRRRRRRAGENNAGGEDDPENTVTKVRESKPLEQQITAVSGSTRLEAKKQRRREGREAGRRRAPIVSEAEFLARRESVERVMVIRQRQDLTQIGVLEDKVLVEHYVARESQTSLIGNIYLGRVQNVLPSMEAAFVDIGKGRNAVLYAGEVNWPALGWKEGQPRKIESVLTSGQSVLVQVTKDPIGHKGARLTSQISLAGRFLVYVPDGTTSGISRKLPDTERNRLKSLLKEIVPDSAGVIVRTAAEGASEDELTRDVERLKARWEDIEAKAKGNAPQLLYGEPDLTLKVVRDLFTEDFTKLVIQGEDAWETVKSYVDHVAPDLADRLERFVPGEHGNDAFSTYRIDEQIAKGLDRKVWLPSGGSLIIDRTEAMTVVDVNTGKFTGSGGNLEETVTKNNLEAAEEIVRQLRLRDIGGIIVVDFIDMVLESNRDLVLRRLVECLGRDRTRHQVAEVTSLGLVQMTRKRIGTGLLEAFSETCTHCHGRGLIVHDHPVEEGKSSGVAPDEPRRGRRRGRGKNNGTGSHEEQPQASAPSAEADTDEGGDASRTPTPAEFAAMARHHDEEALETIGSDDAPEVEATDAVEPAEPAEAVVVEEFDVTPAQPALAEPAARAEEAAEAEPAAPAAEAAEEPAVKVVTRTRGRRGASRPAGVTGDASAVAPVIVAPEPAAVPAAEVSTPEPPKVITRTRRGASRAVTTPEPASAPQEGATAHPEHPVEHVPVKKKGARKR